MEDQFEKKANIKRENVAKNELQRMRNIAAARKVKIPQTGMLPAARPTTKDVSTYSFLKLSFISG